MRSWSRGRPSPAMVVAGVALIVGFSGSAVAGEVVRIAKNSLPGNRLKARSVGGDRIKRNSLTGAEIAESRLSKVPLAARAGVATQADKAALADNALNADAVSGVRFSGISYDTAAPGDFPVTIFERSGVRLTANCANHQLSLIATSIGSPDASLAVTGTDADAAGSSGGAADTDFNAGDTLDIGAAMGSGDADEVIGHLVLDTTSTWILAVDLWLDETPAGCRVSGIAKSAI